MKTASYACGIEATLGVGGIGQSSGLAAGTGCRERGSGALGRLEQSPMLEDGVAIGHPGDVISHCAGAAGGSVCSLRVQRLIAVLRWHETHVLEKCFEKLLHH